jgi:general L-amino acid transport system substrate-binding protein
VSPVAVVVPVRRLLAAAAIVVAAIAPAACSSPGESHVNRIRRRGALICGVSTAVRGFADVDNQGRYTGFDVDICRAMAAAILGSADKVRLVDAGKVDRFVAGIDIDVVSRRLTWSLPREGLGLHFGPITFYDGQGFLVPRSSGLASPRQLAHARICLVPGTVTEANLNAFVDAEHLEATKVVLRSLSEVGAALEDGRCQAATADVSELAALRSTMTNPDGLAILPEMISKEPLAPVVRRGDDQFFAVVRWTVLALIAAEELEVTAANVAGQGAEAPLEVRRLLGIVPGNGQALGLDEKWAATMIAAVGNYGELFERNLGMRSPIRLERGLNRLWRDGGLMYAPPLR